MLLFIVAVLVILGLLMQYSASSYDLALVEKQGIIAGIGFILVFIISRIPAKVIYRLSIPLFIISLGATAITYVIGKEAKGAKRWIIIKGFSLQPSELLKAAMIIMLAAVICHYINEINDTAAISYAFKNRKELGYFAFLKPARGYIAMLFVVSISALTVAVATKDLGTAVILFAVGFFMMFVISPHVKYLVVIIIMGAAAAIGLVIAFPYRVGRITAWLNLDENTSDLGYQIKQGLYAIGSGGLFGKGLGKSIQKDIIPEPHTDMIYSIICEELGIVGGIFIIVLFVLLILRLKSIYDDISDLFGKMIVLGVASHFAIQAFVNMAVLTNLIPNTGVPLPFISYGGTSLICLLGEIGVVMSVRRTGIDSGRYNVYDTRRSNRRMV